jgi:hypothetical protein
MASLHRQDGLLRLIALLVVEEQASVNSAVSALLLLDRPGSDQSDIRLQSAGRFKTAGTDVAIDPGTPTSNCSEIAFTLGSNEPYSRGVLI